MSSFRQNSAMHQKAAMPAVGCNISKCMTERFERGAKPSESGATAQLTPAGFAARFEDAWPTLWFVATAVLNDRSAADDVLQEAAMVALSKLSQFDPKTNFTAWMGKIVRFIALNHARRKVRNGRSGVDVQALDIEATPQVTGNPGLLNGHGQLDVEISVANFDDRVLSALRTLDDTARACLLLRTLMDMPYREISLALDIAEGTAMSHVHRARAVLRDRLAATDARIESRESGHG